MELEGIAGAGGVTLAPLPTLNENAARIALLYACYLALTQQAQAQAGQAWRYQIGDETVDKSRLGDVGMAAASAALQSYRQAVQGFRSWA